MKDLSDLNNIAYLSVGSNIGARLNNCTTGIRLLDETDDVRVEGISDFYLTEPMDFVDQAWFVNGAVRISTRLDPFGLLAFLKSIEFKVGREKADVRFGPRILDFDIIFYNNEIIDTPQLVVPHPRMQFREFVLRPVCDLSPGLVHPVLNKNIVQLIQEIKEGGPRCIKINTYSQGEPPPGLRNSNTADQKEIANEVLY
jgi:2-amino-4-hydroxy-6-hydroxymethyldihydropteridine diphosphokinase